MPHLRQRRLAEILLKVRSHSPIIGILGHRQVGKTTLLEQLTHRYFSLDSKKELLEAQTDPEKYVERRSKGWTALDECQNVPDLFPALKERVRLSKGRPGLFLLSGSVRFTGSPKIRESLTGRITNFELMPMTLGEVEQRPESHAVETLLGLDSYEQGRLEQLFFSTHQESKRLRAAIDLYLERGGLPGICFIREPKIRTERIKSSLETILDRDLRQIVKTNLPYQSILGLLQALASHVGEPIDLTTLSHQTDISRPTIKKLIYALENVFVLRLVQNEGVRRGYSYFFEDIAESNVLSRSARSLHSKLSQALWMNTRASLSFRLGATHEFFQFYSRSAQMSFCIRNEQSMLGLLCMEDPTPRRGELGLADSFLKQYRNSKVCLTHPEAAIRAVNARIAILPSWAIF